MLSVPSTPVPLQTKTMVGIDRADAEFVVQRYITGRRRSSHGGHGTQASCCASLADPFLVRGYKFDMRVYVLVTSFAPLCFYVYNDG